MCALTESHVAPHHAFAWYPHFEVGFSDLSYHVSQLGMQENMLNSQQSVRLEAAEAAAASLEEEKLSLKEELARVKSVQAEYEVRHTMTRNFESSRCLGGRRCT